MPLSSGTRLGTYEITHALGAGGMGEVYRARDSKLGRSVAIKIILDAFAADGERRARFEREAKALAAVNHPNIAALYGMEQADGQHFLVMELVEGETLAERLQRGPLEVDHALAIALQIADALETAHEKGIVHRDLKPANIKITPDEKVKVLDFGLAKAMDTEASGASVSNSPTLSMMATNAGVILGTAAYMSPEQAKGLAADHRSDIFSFGVVLYEMLTGRQPFQGETAPDILASVLVREPELQRLAGDVNPRLPELLRRCLEKSPKRRWQAIGDVRAELESIAAAPRAMASAPVGAPKPLWRRAVPVVAAALITGALAAAVAWRLKPAPPQQLTRFAIALPEDQNFTGAGRQTVAISPDGSRIVYVAENRLFLRSLSSLAAVPIQGTETYQSVLSPVFSPDGQWIAFYAFPDLAIKKIAVTGGAAVTICAAAASPFSITWSGDTILFGQPNGLMRVTANGGRPETIVPFDGDARVQRAELLPGGEAVLFTRGSESTVDRWASATAYAHVLKTGERKTLLEAVSDVRYLPSGHLMFAQHGVLHAVPFDADTLEVRGGPVPVVEGVRRSTLGTSGLAWAAVSANGTLAYVPGPVALSATQLDVGFTDQKGGAVPLKLPPGPYAFPRISPNGKRIAVGSDDGREAVVLLYDVGGSGALQRFTFGGRNRFPIWTSDGKRVVFQSDREGDLGIFWQAADGASAVERLTTAAKDEAHVPESWHPTLDVMSYSVLKGTEHTLWTYSVRDRKSAPFGGVRSAIPIDSVFSPDGRWVAYSRSDGAGTGATVYVQPFPATGATYQLVRSGGDLPHHPLWLPDASGLIVNSRPPVFDVVAISRQPMFAFGKAEEAPKRVTSGPPSVKRPFDIAPDGRIVGLMNHGDTEVRASSQINVVLNWFEELKARVPAR